MDREDLNIVIVDDSKASCTILNTMLIQSGFKNIKIFQEPLDYIMYLKTIEEDDIDIIFIDYEMPVMNGLRVLHYTKFKYPNIVAVMMTSNDDLKIKEKAIKFNVNEFLQKGIDFPEFKARVNILSNLRLYYYQSKEYHKQLETILQYKDQQEHLAVQKQLKIIEDKVSNHYYNKWLATSFFKPHDILSGDSYSTIKITDSHFFISIVDGMGKGVSASLSSVLTVSFMNYSISKSLEFNDFNFDRVVKDTFYYAREIMLDDEALSFAMMEIDLETETIRYLNMGLPPFYLIKENKIEKIRPNNPPLLQKTDNYQIDEFQGFDSFLVASDGLFESTCDEDGYPYFVRFKQNFKNFYLLNDILNDFKKNVSEYDDDTTIFYLKKDTDKYKNIYTKEILLKKEVITKFVDNLEFELIDKLDIKVVNRVVFVLNELLLNCLEHTVLKISENKHEIIQKNEKIEYNDNKKFAHLSLYESERYVIVYLDDKGMGFEVNDILKTEWFNKYHGRGIKTLKKIADGLFYNKKGNTVKLYLKK